MSSTVPTTAADAEADHCCFTPVDHCSFEALTSRQGSERLTKWGLADVLRVRRFRFTGRFREEAAGSFLADLLQSTAFAGEVLGQETPLLRSAAVNFDAVPCSVLNMGFFDALVTQGLMAETGYLKKCLPDATEDFGAGIEVENLVLEMLLNPDSEHAGVFAAEQKNEFIHQLFHTLFVGGVMHQRGDYATEYLETTRALYKQLLTVHKAARSGKIEITSKVYRLREQAHGPTLFQHESKHNRCFVVVDAMKKYATALYVPFKPFW